MHPEELRTRRASSAACWPTCTRSRRWNCSSNRAKKTKSQRRVPDDDEPGLSGRPVRRAARRNVCLVDSSATGVVIPRGRSPHTSHARPVGDPVGRVPLSNTQRPSPSNRRPAEARVVPRRAVAPPAAARRRRGISCVSQTPAGRAEGGDGGGTEAVGASGVSRSGATASVSRTATDQIAARVAMAHAHGHPEAERGREQPADATWARRPGRRDHLRACRNAEWAARTFRGRPGRPAPPGQPARRRVPLDTQNVSPLHREQSAAGQRLPLDLAGDAGRRAGGEQEHHETGSAGGQPADQVREPAPNPPRRRLPTLKENSSDEVRKTATGKTAAATGPRHNRGPFRSPRRRTSGRMLLPPGERIVRRAEDVLALGRRGGQDLVVRRGSASPAGGGRGGSSRIGGSPASWAKSLTPSRGTPSQPELAAGNGRGVPPEGCRLAKSHDVDQRRNRRQGTDAGDGIRRRCRRRSNRPGSGRRPAPPRAGWPA